MVCLCCYLPNICLQLLSASVLGFITSRFFDRGKRSQRFARLTVILVSTLTLVFTLFLIALSAIPVLRQAWFAKLCVTLSQPGPLDLPRCEVAGQAYGKVLELGPGPGTNFRCYEDAKIEQLTGIEPNEYFKAELMAEKEKQHLTFPVEQRWLRGEELDVEPGTFDSVVGTHVLCTVEDVVGVLSNVKKALKPGGTYLFMEHVAAEEGTWLRTAQKLVEPAFTIIANSCRFKNIEGILRREMIGWECDITAFDGPMPLPPFVPHIRGSCIKPK